MTPDERRNDKIINGSRRKRIASGSGTSVEDVNRLLKQFGEMKKMLQMLGGGGMPKLPKGMKVPPHLQGQLRQAQAHAQAQGAGQPGGKKRKKGGPWGLIKTR
jgi:signal recognition particle GTPase